MTNKNIELSFDEIGVIYNALTLDIKQEERKLFDAQMANPTIDTGEYKPSIYENMHEDTIKRTKELRAKINEMMQNFNG